MRSTSYGQARVAAGVRFTGNELAFLIDVDPRTYVLLAGQEEGCDGETWGLSLAFDQSRKGLRIAGLVEDIARICIKGKPRE